MVAEFPLVNPLFKFANVFYGQLGAESVAQLCCHASIDR